MSKSSILTYFYILLIFIGTAKVYFTQTADTAAMSVQKKHIVIDAGHGGFDPGKANDDGTEEKTVNLEIAKLLQGYLEQSGADVGMTRIEDEALARTKNGDMKERVKLGGNCDVFVSIHQNSYPSPNVHGAQVFYYKESEEGKKLAELVQKRIKEYADADNTREAKPNSSYYILKKAGTPSIIVECGFLSNPEENKKLNDPDYQKQIARAVYMGIIDYFNTPET